MKEVSIFAQINAMGSQPAEKAAEKVKISVEISKK